MLPAISDRAWPPIATLLSCTAISLLLVGAPLAQTSPQSSSSSIVDLPAATVADYWVSATRQSGETVVFDGYAPDKSTVDAFSQTPDADVSFLKLGGGAPSQYRRAMDFALTLLARMSEGRVALRGNALSISGIAASATDYRDLLDSSTRVPDGVTLAENRIQAPVLSRYAWSAVRSNNGSIRLSGSVPNPQIEADLVRLAGPATVESMTYASGEPPNFASMAPLALSLLNELEEGRVTLDGSTWLLQGQPASTEIAGRLEGQFTQKGLARQGWSLSLAEPRRTEVAQAPAVTLAPETPPPAAQQTAPTVDAAYSFSASIADGGALILSGQVPDAEALQKLSAIGQGDSAAVSIAAGAPDDFTTHAQAGLTALLKLQQGQLDFSQGTWRLSGTASDAATRDTVVADLSKSPNAPWQTDIVLAAPPETPSQDTPAVASATSSPTAKADISACNAPLAEFSSRNAILFRSGAAQITPESAPALDELATDLAACPDAVVHVEGHTDADGDDQANLALSVARAEAVVNALVERQVNPQRLYAVGYGEAQPVAPNDTAEGKRLNRRIVITVLDQHF